MSSESLPCSADIQRLFALPTSQAEKSKSEDHGFLQVKTTDETPRKAAKDDRPGSVAAQLRSEEHFG